MISLRLKEPTTLEAIGDLLQSRFPGRFENEVKNGRLRMVASSTKGCIISLRARDGRTNCTIVGFMPSIAHRALLLLGLMIALSLLTSLLLGGFNAVLGGAVPFVIAFFAMKLPSRDLVADVTAVLEGELADAARPGRKSFGSWPVVGAGAGLVILIALAVLMRPEPQTAARHTPAKTIVERPALPVVLYPQPTDADLPNEYSVIARLSGRISELHPDLRPGAIIPRETVLVRIDAKHIVDSLQRSEEALNVHRHELASIEAETSVVRNMLESKRQQLAAEPDERLQAIARQEAENFQEELQSFARRRQLSESAIEAIEREIVQTKLDLARTEISLPNDVRIDAVMIKNDEFVSSNSVLFEATGINTAADGKSQSPP